jgi:hypothetical protein
MRGYGEHSWFTKDQGVSYARREFGNLVEVSPRDLELHKNSVCTLYRCVAFQHGIPREFGDHVDVAPVPRVTEVTE